MTAALVMANAARPGFVKTRLEPLLGPDGCAMLQARLTARAARLAAAVAPGAAYAAIDPPAAAEQMADLVGPDVELFGQRGESLGERLTAASAHVFERADGPLAVIGTDAPTIGPPHLEHALELVRSECDAAIGPALDGGYYLIALARPLPALFNLPPRTWGGQAVLGLTLRAARRARLRVELLEPAPDLDTPADAEALLSEDALPDDIAALLRVPAGG